MRERSRKPANCFVLRQGPSIGIAWDDIGRLAVAIATEVGLIGTPSQIWLAAALVDMRRGIDGLSAIVQQGLGHQPCSVSTFVFRNRAGNRLRLLVWDGNGVWLCHRRLHQGVFVWPKVKDRCYSVCSAQWRGLVTGVDWQRQSICPQPDWQV
jgi:transposase